MNFQSTMLLPNGVAIPRVGYGTFRTPTGEITRNAVRLALEHGYRHIDAAAIYGNEASVGQAIAESGVSRQELFVTSKVWNEARGYETTFKAFEKTLADLQLDYLDLYLIHWPAAANRFENWEAINAETWRAMVELHQAGRIRAIGVSNFKPHHLKALLDFDVKPMVNQIEFHPGWRQSEVVDFSRAHGMVIEAWSPLANGDVLKDARIAAIAQKYGKSPAQVVLRWVLQHDVVVLTKAVTESRMVENTELFDFSLSAEDMAVIDSIDNFAFTGLDPDTNDF